MYSQIHPYLFKATEFMIRIMIRLDYSFFSITENPQILKAFFTMSARNKPHRGANTPSVDQMTVIHLPIIQHTLHVLQLILEQMDSKDKLLSHPLKPLRNCPPLLQHESSHPVLRIVFYVSDVVGESHTAIFYAPFNRHSR